jgi:hypothetical protein
MVAAVMNAGCMYLGPALQAQPTAEQLGTIAGLEAAAPMNTRKLLDAIAACEDDEKHEDIRDRQISAEWSRGYLRGLRLTLSERDYE